ncbi:uncharacterized protein LOC135169440 [Diachasmimorpha longicaudata]|uniref:uncharacterized protein LOC135169440 n=1 Tax=Diachasmimorpha longicaudata TaxID=58733 RepID=UPI0030B8A308
MLISGDYCDQQNMLENIMLRYNVQCCPVAATCVREFFGNLESVFNVFGNVSNVRKSITSNHWETLGAPAIQCNRTCTAARLLDPKRSSALAKGVSRKRTAQRNVIIGQWENLVA